jgi:carboxyl-terminal processing protease
MKIRKVILPVAIFAASLMSVDSGAQVLNEETFKVGRVLSLVDAFYVDSVNLGKIAEEMIVSSLKKLDPHSTYISAKDVKEMNEPLQGNFEGIGIQFNILHDTIIVIEPIGGGPSEKVGLRAGDRIVTINKEKVTNIGMSTSGVFARLRGPKGTIVNLTVFRKGEKELLDFTITRDKIPIFSLDAAYMLDNQTAYLKFNKFAVTTEQEFRDAILKLRQNNKLNNVIIDLRLNGGGYMLAATDMAKHFFADPKLLVYLIGRKIPRQDYTSLGGGDLSDARLVVLTDENSASASEIFAGAIQDWDRGVIIGRRTFGKGLVQNGYTLTDGSMIRLTIARYYTPTGRSIQSSYKDGYDKYIENFMNRYSNGELFSADSIRLPDTLKYKTLVTRRTVYGGGGIVPDVFVAPDTSFLSDYYRALYRKDIFRSWVLEYSDANRDRINKSYKTFTDFRSKFNFSQDDVRSFIKKGEDAGIKFDESQYGHSEKEILLILKALVASNIWQTSEYFQVLNENDNVIGRALQIINDSDTYKKILGMKQR